MVKWFIVSSIIIIAAVIMILNSVKDIWLIAFIVLTIAAIFTALIVYYLLKKTVSNRAKKISTILVVFYFALAYIIFLQFYNQSNFQKEHLLSARNQITYSIMQLEIRGSLLNVLKAYQLQSSTDRKTIGQLFNTLVFKDSLKNEKLKFLQEEDRTYFYAAKVEDNKVVYVGLSLFSKGKNPKFKNFNGITGKIQTKGTLTNKGIEYAIEN
jgi:phosphate/sulfate permease